MGILACTFCANCIQLLHELEPINYPYPPNAGPQLIRSINGGFSNPRNSKETGKKDGLPQTQSLLWLSFYYLCCLGLTRKGLEYFQREVGDAARHPRLQDTPVYWGRRLSAPLHLPHSGEQETDTHHRSLFSNYITATPAVREPIAK